jgi:hypothetical protein
MIGSLGAKRRGSVVSVRFQPQELEALRRVAPGGNLSAFLREAALTAAKQPRKPPTYTSAEVLSLIAEDRPPCRRCHRPHQQRMVQRGKESGPDWSDPSDGHTYERMSHSEFARMVKVP